MTARLGSIRARLLLTVGSLLTADISAASDDQRVRANERYVAVYGGLYSPERFKDLITAGSPNLRSSGLVSLAYGRALRQQPRSQWDVEVQLGQHFGRQSHQEVNALIVARWLRFPWDSWLDTRMAFGEGLSYATRVPPLEPRSDGEGRSTRLLNYLMAEIEVIVLGQSSPNWSTFLRVHHRSGVFGLFNGISGGSNYVGLGVRYRFQH